MGPLLVSVVGRLQHCEALNPVLGLRGGCHHLLLYHWDLLITSHEPTLLRVRQLLLGKLGGGAFRR